MHFASVRWAASAALLTACGGSEFTEATDAGATPDSSISGSTGGAAGSSAGVGGTMGGGGSTNVGVGVGGAAGGTGGSTRTGGAGGAAGNGGGAGSGGGNGGASVDGGACSPACGLGLVCCGTTCVNPHNDIMNCGGCGNQCRGTAPFCNGTSCVTPPCLGGACDAQGLCCGDQCCATGKLCCEVPGPGPSLGPRCTDPVGATCPVGCPACQCASPDTPIATPEGAKPIAALNVGDRVYSLAQGRVVSVPILRINRVAAASHVVVRLVTASGVVLEISAMHPTADGRTVGALRDGDLLDGVRVLATSIVPYEHAFTYDILPDSETGAYFPGGLLIGSTLGGTAIGACGGVTQPSSVSRTIR